MARELEVWTILDRPLDYPHGFVVRRYLVDSKGQLHIGMKLLVADTLDQARKLVPAGLYCMPREPGDSPCIVESYL